MHTVDRRQKKGEEGVCVCWSLRARPEPGANAVSHEQWEDVGKSILRYRTLTFLLQPLKRLTKNLQGDLQEVSVA